MISVIWHSKEIRLQMFCKSTNLPFTFRLHAKNVRRHLPSFYLCTRTGQVTRKMEFKDSSILSNVLNIVTSHIQIELSDDSTWVVGFMRKMTGTHWSMSLCRRNWAQRLSRILVCSDSKAILWQKKSVAKWDEGLNGGSFPFSQSSFDMSQITIWFRFEI